MEIKLNQSLILNIKQIRGGIIILFVWITRLETYLLVKAKKLELKLSNEEWNTRKNKQHEKIKAAYITNILTKDINLD